MPKKGRGRGGSRRGGKGSQPASKPETSTADIKKSGAKKVEEEKEEKKVLESKYFIGIDFGSSYIKVAVVGESKQLLPTNEEKKEEEEWQSEIEKKYSMIMKDFKMTEGNTSKDALMEQLLTTVIRVQQDDSGHRLIPNVLTFTCVPEDANEASSNSVIGYEAMKASIQHNRNCVYQSNYLCTSAANESTFNAWKSRVQILGMQSSLEWDSDRNEAQLANLNMTVTQCVDQMCQKLTEMLCHILSCRSQDMFAVITFSKATGGNNPNPSANVNNDHSNTDPNASAVSQLQKGLEKRGIHVLQCIDNDVSALNAYGLLLENGLANGTANGKMTTSAAPRYVCVVDYGTMQSTLSVHKILENGTSVRLHRHQNPSICGHKLDELIMKYCADDFKQKSKGLIIEPGDRKTRLKLKQEIDAIKNVLLFTPASNEVTLYVESLMEGEEYHTSISKARFERLIYDCYKNIPNWIAQEISALNLEKDASFEVIVCGGLAHLNKFVECTLQGWPTLQQSSVKLLSRNGLEAVYTNVIGCAVQAFWLKHLWICHDLHFATNQETFPFDISSFANATTSDSGPTQLAFLDQLISITFALIPSAAHFKHAHSKLSFQSLCSIPTHTWLPFYTTCALAKSLLLDDSNTNGKDDNSESDDIGIMFVVKCGTSPDSTQVLTIRRIYLTHKQMNKKNNLFVTVTFDAEDGLSIIWSESNVPSEPTVLRFGPSVRAKEIENDNDNDVEEENEIDDNDNGNENENDDQNIIDVN
ncbi:hypothetical protein RFI_22509 [Reticulomyxa filosa]|uniref:Uncharacterized protein n=1 Tax=Reticulomyxa filosa TaxID=46433 RepID=X6MLH2_RETFI|nr:hypothetical protein RFI_22509 [Reticulomyxa filosa]|eukprot:ETO14858.1 hypothetical protein RFI_22509 [Reticulomyxa filosa]